MTLHRMPPSHNYLEISRLKAVLTPKPALRCNSNRTPLTPRTNTYNNSTRAYTSLTGGLTRSRERLPFELIDKIISLAIFSVTTKNTESGDSIYHELNKINPFTAIKNISLTSYDFRRTAFKHYFSELRIHTPKQWESTCRVLRANNGFSYVRSLHGPSAVLGGRLNHLQSFTHLQSLSVDLSAEGLATQHNRIKILLKHIAPTPQRSPLFPPTTHRIANNPAWPPRTPSRTPRQAPTQPSNRAITSLTLHALPRIDVTLLSHLARALPELVTLHLSCTERLDMGCCWTCLEESTGCTVHSPVPDVHGDVKALAIPYGEALKDLARLEHVHFGIFLSDEGLLAEHIHHVELGAAPLFDIRDESRPEQAVWEEPEMRARIDDDVCTYSIPFISASTKIPLTPWVYTPHANEDDFFIFPPHGPDACNVCRATDLASAVRMDELKASIMLAQRLVNIKSIGWSSFFGCGGEVGHSSGEGDMKRAHTVWVQRHEGEVRVRRTPW